MPSRVPQSMSPGPAPPCLPTSGLPCASLLFSIPLRCLSNCRGLRIAPPRCSRVDPSRGSDRKANLLSLNIPVQKPEVPQQDPTLLAELSIILVLLGMGTTIPQPPCFPHWAGTVLGPHCAARRRPSHRHSEGPVPTSWEQ